jgi:hypothetical protein
MNNLDYILMACDSQDFDDWFLDSQYYAVGQNAAGGANKWAVNFDDWSTNNQQKAVINFNSVDWIEPYVSGLNEFSHWTYPSENQPPLTVNYWVEYSYQIWNSRLFNDPTNNIAVAEFQSNQQQCFMFPSEFNDIHDYGVGSVSFKYKVVDDNVYPVLADMTLTNSFNSEVNYRVEAQVEGFGENFDDGNYHAIRLRQVDDSNYIECRIVQTYGNRYQMEIWLCEANVLSRKYYRPTDLTGYRGSLEEGGKYYK